MSRHRLHRTPVRHTMLRRVHDNGVRWRNVVGRTGFIPAHQGPAYTDPTVLAALWELYTAGLIWIDAPNGAVRVSPRGVARLSEWDSTRAGAR